MTRSWPLSGFETVLADVSAGNPKTLQSDFLPAGRFPIIDQGKDLIGGYTDDEARLCRCELPVIVFGDHTRFFKYIDFPFCIGADGVKVLRPLVDVDLRYLYHFLNQVRITEGGYSRHYKFLKRIDVPLPPLPEQRRIAVILDQADTLRAKRREALAKLDQLTQAIFLDMFGDPVTNPMGWPRIPLPRLVAGRYGVKAGPFGSSLRKVDYAPSGYRVYGQEQVVAGRFDIGDYYIDERKYQQLKACAVSEGDVLVSLVGSFGRALVVPPDIEPGIINPRLLKISPDHSLMTSVYLASFLAQGSTQEHLQRISHGGTMGILNASLVKRLQIPLPPIGLQQQFCTRLSALDRIRAAEGLSLGSMETLFSSLQHRAFRGEL